jgi:hypothetical protein
MTACAGSAPPPPPVSDAQISAAEQAGNLEGLYEEVGGKIADPLTPPEELPALQAVHKQIGDRLAAELAADVRKELDETPRIQGVLPANVLAEQRARLEPMRTWSASQYLATNEAISAEMKATKAAIAERETQLAGMTDENVVGRLELLDQLAAISGAGSKQALGYAEQRKALVTTLNAEAMAAIEAEDYEEARRVLTMVQEIDPSDSETVEKLATVNTKVFEQEFWAALETGDPDQGYALLTSIAATESFGFIRPNLASSTDVMADYYVSLGAAATKKGDIPEAYRRFNEARAIRQLLGEGSAKPPAEEKAFVKLLEKAYAAAWKQGDAGLAWGYLHVIKSLQQDTPELRRQLREGRETVLQRAIKRLSVGAFESPDDSTAEFGDAVASKVVQHLFESIPNDVRMIEREQLGDIIREKELGKSKAKKGSGELAAADYLVQGTILEAKVDTTEKVGKKTMRVVTEQVEQANPEYTRWSSMSSKDRKDLPEPPKTVIVPRKEDVTVEVTVHRKVGIFSVSFRVIDAGTAKVLFADSVRAKTQHDDTSSEGVELGDFKMEFKLASLPSDIEMLAMLADEVSLEIGNKLAAVLATPEVTYQENADRFMREANYQAAAQQYAYAIVLKQRKDEDVEPLMQKLRDSSIAASR